MATFTYSGPTGNTVSSFADLNNAIATFDGDSRNRGGIGNNYVIVLQAGITLTELGNLYAINLTGSDTLTIEGQGATLSGANQYRGLLVYSGTVLINNLTISNTVARGGSGGLGSGGGGAGFGGGLLVANNAGVGGAVAGNVTLSNVTFTADQAIGGNGARISSYGVNRDGGGGGGLGGNGGNQGQNNGGGGGVGGAGASSTPNDTSAQNSGATGLIYGAASGGGIYGQNLNGSPIGGGYGGGGAAGAGYRVTFPNGSASIEQGAGAGGGVGGGNAGWIGGNSSTPASSVPASGGWGGGGGGYDSTNSTVYGGNNGGFGGGAGGGGGNGGYGGGASDGYSLPGFGGGQSVGGAGGGFGAGGAIFVQAGASLTIRSALGISGGAVAGGSGAYSTEANGLAGGSGIFLQGGQFITLAAGAGQVQTIGDVIADEAGLVMGASGVNAGVEHGGLTIQGAGTAVLSAANTFTGGIRLLSGTLKLANDRAAGAGRISFGPGRNTLVLAAGVHPTEEIAGFAAGDAFDIEGVGETANISLSFTQTLNAYYAPNNQYFPGSNTLALFVNGSRTLFFYTEDAFALASKTFRAVSDGHGGILVTLGGATPVLADGDFQAFDIATGGAGVTADNSGGNYLYGAPTGWTGSGRSGGRAAFGAIAPTTATAPGFAGTTVARLDSGGSISQTVAPPGTFASYTVTFDYGSTLAANATGLVQVYAGATLVGSLALNTATAGAGAKASGTVTTSNLATLGLLGQAITVRVSDTGGGVLLVDNVVVSGTDARSGSTVENANLLVDGDFRGADLTSGFGTGVVVEPVQGNYTGAPAPGWTLLGGGNSGTFRPTLSAAPGFVDTNVAYLLAGSAIQQVIQSPGRYGRYQVSLDLGGRADIGATPSGLVDIYAGSTLVGEASFDGASVAAGSAAHLVVTTGSLVAQHLLDLAITVVIRASGGQLLATNVIATGYGKVGAITAPVLSGVADSTSEATGAAGAAVARPAVTATDNSEGPETIVFVGPGGAAVQPNQTFAIGTTTITVTATNSYGLSTSATYSVVVRDTTAPVLSAQGNLSVAPTSAAGAVATFSVTATDLVDGAEPVTYTDTFANNAIVQSGQVFAIGTHTITARATDSHQNVGTRVFQIVVGGGGAPTVSSAAEFNSYVLSYDQASRASNGGMGVNYVIRLAAGAVLGELADLAPIDLRGTDTLTIEGQGATFDGAGQYAGLFVYAGRVTVKDLTVRNTRARGGDGQDSAGGGAGLGGGLFVANDGVPGIVTLQDVVFLNDGALGGAGSLGNSTYGAGGSLNGSNPQAAGQDVLWPDGFGRQNGFGAGAGGIRNSYAGFGGGGEGGQFNGAFGGIGGGDAIGGAGGGGLGAGGGIFVSTGSSITFAGGGSLSGGYVAGGARVLIPRSSTRGSQPGQAWASGIFLQGGQTVGFAPGANQVQVIADEVDDLATFVGGGAENAGSLVLSGAGVLELDGPNQFTGGVLVNSGTLRLGNALGAGRGSITFAPSASASLVLSAGISPTSVVSGFDGNDKLIVRGIGLGAFALLGAGNVLSVSDGVTTATVRFDPAQDLSAHVYRVAADAGGGVAVSDTLLLADGDFQQPVLASGTAGVTVDATRGNSTAVAPAGWTGTGQVGAFAPTAAATIAFRGSQVAYLNAGAVLSQTFTQPPPYQMFRLDLDLSGRLDDAGAFPTAVVTVLSGSTILAQQTVGTAAAGRGNATHVTLTTLDLAVANLLGAPITVRVADSGTTQLLVDNVVVRPLNLAPPPVLTALDQTARATGPGGVGTLVLAATGVDAAGNAVPIMYAEDGTALTAGSSLGVGDHAITASGRDAFGRTTTAGFVLHVVDIPTLSAQPNVTAEAAGPGGGTAAFTVTASDAVDGTAPVVFREGGTVVVAGQTVFSLGAHAITASATNSFQQTVSASFTVTVVDTTAPAIGAGPGTVEAVSAGGAPVTLAGATDLVDGTDLVTSREGGATVTSGQVFALGTHTIAATSIDAHGNTGQRTYSFTVVDTTAPVLSAQGVLSFEAEGAQGAHVALGVTASDLVDGTDVVTYREGGAAVASGQVFSIGDHAITASATDAHGNTGTRGFTIHVIATPPVISVPPVVTVEATGPGGAASVLPVTVSDVVDGTGPVVLREGGALVTSGQVFSLGSHAIMATAVDSRGFAATPVAFTLQVVDRTAPVLSRATTLTVAAAGAVGSAVATFGVTATDVVDGALPVNYAEGGMAVASGQAFGLGLHTITARATDAAGNVASTTFQVRVTGTGTASTGVDLDRQIQLIDALSAESGGNGMHYVITLVASAVLSQVANPYAINLHGTDTLTIDGQGAVLDGGGVARGLFVYSGSVAVNDLTIRNALAQGGAGSGGSYDLSGGGAAGLGGGLFVANDAARGVAPGQVSLSGVTFSGNRAVGGHGGSYSYDPSYNYGAGGGLGGDATGSDGDYGLPGPGVPGTNGFGQGGTFNLASGFGGGQASYDDTGAYYYGGFGGGGAYYNAPPFGGGYSEGAYGGGGLGAGGDIFVQGGGGLTIAGAVLTDGRVQAGIAYDYPQYYSGNAFGAGLFLQGNAAVRFAPGAGQTVTVAEAIADQAGNGDNSGLPSNGRLVLDGAGTLVLGVANSFTGGVTIAAGTLSLAVARAAGSGAVTFAPGTSGALVIAASALPAGGGLFGNTLVNFDAGDSLDLVGFTATVAPTVANHVLTFAGTVGGQAVTERFTLSGTESAQYFAVSDGTGGTRISDGTPCYCRGTMILTEAGEVAVQDLRIGDRLVVRSGGVQPIRWIGMRSYAGRFAAGNRDVLPVLFRAGALSDGVPRRDLMVSPLHAMFLDGALIPAFALVNGASVVQVEAVEQVEYFHLELTAHDVILAEGAESETFLDDGNRGMFINAAEYRALYPDAATGIGRYCAPRLEDGAVVEAVRRRLAVRAGVRAAVAPLGELLGFLDAHHCTRGLITGWACDADAPDVPVRLRIVDNGVAIGEVSADVFRADLRDAGIGNGQHAFAFAIEGGLSRGESHVIEVQRAGDGRLLANSPWMVAAANPLPCPADDSPCDGHIDVVTRERVTGWLRDPAEPHGGAAVQVLDNGVVVARTVANRFRADLADGGIGDGRHSFDVGIPGGLAPEIRHVIEVRRERDGAPLGGSPHVIEAADRFGPEMERALAGAVAAADGAQRERVLSFMLAQAEVLRQHQADGDGRRSEREAHRRDRDGTGLAAAGPGLRALVVDERAPVAGRDAGSMAILSHIRALRALGYAVSFAGADELAVPDLAAAGLAAAGIEWCGAPLYASVEDVLRRQADCFDVVYLHRVGVAERYMALARWWQGRARVLYGVADLHHLRLERQAQVEEQPELLLASRRVRLAECMAALSADAVITHSAAEAEWLRGAVPDARVHRVMWDVPLRPTTVGFAARRGVAFIGNYEHAPNVDAARWLVEAVMPLVWREDADVPCLLVGAGMPDGVRRLGEARVQVVGRVEDLGPGVFDRVRLTVAPLRYGAGVKGKVLESLAAGVPCVMTPVGAEGLALPASLERLVAGDAAGLAKLICRLHRNARAHGAVRKAGLAWVRESLSTAGVVEGMRDAVEGRRNDSLLRRTH